MGIQSGVINTQVDGKHTKQVKPLTKWSLLFELV